MQTLSLQLELEVASKRFLWRLVAFGLPMPAVPEPQKAESDATLPEIAKAALKILVQHLESIEASVAVRAVDRDVRPSDFIMASGPRSSRNQTGHIREPSFRASEKTLAKRTVHI